MNEQPGGTVIVYTNHTCNDPNKQSEGNAIVLAIPTTLTIFLINNQKVLALS
jgi:hypothetical protein